MSVGEGSQESVLDRLRRDWEPRFIEFLDGHADPDPAHGIVHLKRVVATALRLAQEEGARIEVVLPAAWLHDCVNVPKNSPDRPRASRIAAEHAVRFLKAAGYAPQFLDGIAHAIEAHSFSAGVPPRTVEARVVQDADRLDAIGAIGLARCIAVGTALGRPLYAPEDPFCENREPDDRGAAVDHFYTKLLKLAGTMQTGAGRREAARRTEFLETFLRQLRSEIGA